MKKILILGGSHRDIPLIKASKALGYFVMTLGNGVNYLGHGYADRHYEIDFNDLETVKKIISTEKVDYLIPGCGEASYLNTVQLSHELHIGNFDDLKTARLIHNKWKFKAFCLQHEISTPTGFFYHTDNDIGNLNFPIVVKPTSLSGGRGVKIVHNIDEFHAALKEAKKVSQEIFFEEYVEGELIAYSLFLQNQKIIYDFVGKDESYLNKYLITLAYPIKIDDRILAKLKFDIEKLARLLSMVDGMFHLQIIIKDGVPYIIDVTRRIPGDFYPYLIETCDKVDYSKAVVKSYLDKTLANEFISPKEKDFVLRYCVMPDTNGIYENLVIDESIKKDIIFRIDLMQVGDRIENYLNTQIAILLIKTPDMNSNALKNINNLIYPKVKPQKEL